MNAQGPQQLAGHSRRTGDGRPNPVQIQKLLSGLNYPASKDRIVRKARDEGADAHVLQALERLPERDYDSPVSVSREVGKGD